MTKPIKAVKAWAVVDNGKILVMWDKDAASWPKAIYKNEAEAIRCQEFYHDRGHTSAEIQQILISPIKPKRKKV